jgi:NADH-quinone oxidoreductase subunit K
MIEGIPLNYFLIVSTLMFFIGIYGFLTRRNLITMLMSIELILNSVNINFVAFNKYLYPDKLQGHFFTLIVIAVAAAEAAIAIAIIINIYRNFRSIDVNKVDEMKF